INVRTKTKLDRNMRTSLGVRSGDSRAEEVPKRGVCETSYLRAITDASRRARRVIRGLSVASLAAFGSAENTGVLPVFPASSAACPRARRVRAPTIATRRNADRSRNIQSTSYVPKIEASDGRLAGPMHSTAEDASHEAFRRQSLRPHGVPVQFLPRAGLLGVRDARSVRRGDPAGLRGEGADGERHREPIRGQRIPGPR